MCCEKVRYQLNEERQTEHRTNDEKELLMEASYALAVTCPVNVAGGKSTPGHAYVISMEGIQDEVNTRQKTVRDKGWRMAKELLGEEHLVFEEVPDNCFDIYEYK